jgi:hypothetical protein
VPAYFPSADLSPVFLAYYDTVRFFSGLSCPIVASYGIHGKSALPAHFGPQCYDFKEQTLLL